jgi:hypothetical protein
LPINGSIAPQSISIQRAPLNDVDVILVSVVSPNIPAFVSRKILDHSVFVLALEFNEARYAFSKFRVSPAALPFMSSEPFVRSWKLRPFDFESFVASSESSLETFV